MKLDPHNIDEPKPLKLIGKRALISIDMLPFMHMLNPFPLILATLRNPPGLIYPKKIFNELKRTLLARTFRKSFLKNQQKVKFLIRGYEVLKKQKLSVGKWSLKPTQTMIPKNFNLNQVKEWFDHITQPSVRSHNLSFVESVPMIIERRREADNRACIRMRKLIREIVGLQQKKEYKECEAKYKKNFLKMAIPWTENIYKEVEDFGEKLWERYLRDELCDFKTRKLRGSKTKRIKKTKKNTKEVEKKGKARM